MVREVHGRLLVEDVSRACNESVGVQQVVRTGYAALVGECGLGRGMVVVEEEERW